MMCDVLIAADTAKFGQPEIKLGVLPGMGGSQRLTRAIGKAKAMDLILTGRTIDAEEADRAGLVSRVVPADELLREAKAVATTISQMSLSASRMAKEAVNRAFESHAHRGPALRAQAVPLRVRHRRPDRGYERPSARNAHRTSRTAKFCAVVTDTAEATERSGTAAGPTGAQASRGGNGITRSQERFSALVFLWLSMTPSLLPRGPLFQGLVSGAAGAIGYGLGVFLVWLVQYMRSKDASPHAPRWAWLAVVVVGVIGQILMIIYFHVWQDDVRDLMGVPRLTFWDHPLTARAVDRRSSSSSSRSAS